jgi:hypothetical protein
VAIVESFAHVLVSDSSATAQANIPLCRQPGAAKTTDNRDHCDNHGRRTITIARLVE